MSTKRFFRYELRTTDVEGAARFYVDVLGLELRSGDVGSLEIARLPEQAVARGAKPHWLGHVSVENDVDSDLRALLADGAQQLGPMQQRSDGARHAIVRHPIGAMLALSSAPALPPDPRIAWHQLATTDHERALALWARMFGWTARDKTLLAEYGPNVTFGWDASGPAIGGVSDSAERPEIHTQWLFHFRVTDLEATCEEVRARGGLALPIMALPDGRRIAACDDPQGGAFGLLQPA
jgi:predicted enzyme related to lactoylglutathione lyase